VTAPALKNSVGTVGLLALDEAHLLAEALGLSLEEPTNVTYLNGLISELVRQYSPHVTGVVLDPIYSLPFLAQKDHVAGLVLRLEQLNDSDPLALPKFIPNWSIENVKNNYGLAKLELFYHPSEEKSAEKKQLVAEIFDFCQYEKIDFLLKLVIYHPSEKKLDVAEFQEVQLEAVSELQRFASMMALQYPQDPLATATLTTNLDIPWLLLAENMNYDAYKEALRVSLENGAAGFYIGKTLWQEIGSLRLEDQSVDDPAIQQWLKTTGRDRVLELKRLIEEKPLA
jgi:tagatose-1,6-bisphosphate aldolase